MTTIWVSILLLILCSPVMVLAQKENNIWHFGSGAGLDFNVNPPKAIYGFTLASTPPGTASICDGLTGELLFMTNGERIWNRHGQTMPNGQSLGGTLTFFQSVLILPFQQKRGFYYIITCDGSGSEDYGVRYSIVDMSLDNGNGDVVTKSISLFESGMSEKLTAIPHANGCDLWILTHKRRGNEYCATLLQDDIMSTTPIISAIGHSANRNWDTYYESVGALVSSQKGDRIAYVTFSGYIDVLDFDRATGKMSNLVHLSEGSDSYLGACFSPDGSKLYVSTPNNLYQFDLTAPVLQVRQTKTLLDTARMQDISTREEFGAIRPGPDGRIYCAVLGWGKPVLGVIENPNLAGKACGFSVSEMLLSSSWAYSGLPNVIDALLNKPMQPCLPASVSTSRGQQSNEFSFFLSPNPAKDVLMVHVATELVNAEVKIVNTAGQTQIVRSVNCVANTTLSFDISQLSTGVYSIIFQTSGNTASNLFQIIR